MCGLFGCTQPTDAALVLQAALAAARRGPHAWGVVVLRRDGTHVWRRYACGDVVASIREHLPPLLVDFAAVLGHCRLATSGTYSDAAEAQPLQAGTLWIAHNGTTSPERLRQAIADGVHPATANDSEVIGLLAARRVARGESLAAAMRHAAEHCAPNKPYALAAMTTTGDVTLLRRAHPLLHDGALFCSCGFSNWHGALIDTENDR